MENAFTKMLVAARGERSKTEVASGAAVDRTSIVKAEQGDRLLRPGTLRKLCVFYQIDLNNALDLMAAARNERDKRRIGGNGALTGRSSHKTGV